MPTYQEHALRRQDVGGMNESISNISILLQEVAGHIAGGKQQTHDSLLISCSAYLP